MPATPIRSSPADSMLEQNNQTLASTRREASSLVEPASAEPSGSANTGNNTRSFRFLLTLALRKAQTAVTLDNGGHVDEAIRTYREAISMLGLVLNRTNEEDGRQRLLHFRQTYSDRVSVLSSLRPGAAVTAVPGQTESTPNDTHLQNADSSYEPHALQQSEQQLPTQGEASSSDSPTQKHNLDNDVAKSAQPIDTTTQLLSSSATNVSPIPIPERTQGSATPENEPMSASSENANSTMLTMDLSPALGLGPDESLSSSMDVHKPLPLLESSDSAQSQARKYSMASNASAKSTSHVSHTTAEDDASISSSSTEDPDDTGAEAYAENEDTTSAIQLEKPTKKGSGKGSAKASRRQSIKNQRSLPAMFGLKSKKESKAAPPVPSIPIVQNNAPKFGRRLLGALRSNSNADSQPGRPNTSRGNSEDASSSAVAGSEEQTAEASVNDQVSQHATDLSTAEQQSNSKRVQELNDVPPPTPAKDSPPIPAKVTASTLTREQKRQSNAAHRLAGLFKRKPSVPDIPSPALPSKYSADSSKQGAMTAQSPSTSHMLPKDRRLSASASTPNLLEAAAAAAHSDQPALAAFAASERGVVPPMPAPPNLRPSFSANNHPAIYSESAVDSDMDNDQSLDALARTNRGGSVSDAASTHSAVPSRLDDKLRRKQPSIHQPHSARPALKITTKSTADMPTYIPEDSPLPSAPVIGGADDVTRSRKSSIATTTSQTLARGNGSLPYGLVGVGNSSSGTALAFSQQIYGRPTLVDIEEDQRSEMFDPSFGTFHVDLGPPPPKSSPLSSLWFMNTLHRSMVSTGAYLTTSMYIPRRLWYQSGIRIAAIDIKLSVLAQLSQSLVSISSLLSLPDIDALTSSAIPKPDDRRAETVPWESEDSRARNNQERDELHKSCVALHHWLNNLEETLESSRRLLGKKLKFINQATAAASNTGSAAVGGAPPQGQGLAGTSNENLQTSTTHLPLIPSYFGSQDNSIGNTSFSNLALSSADIPSGGGVPVSPLSPNSGDPMDMRASELQAPETPSSAIFSSMSASSANLNRDMLSKDQMSNARFKGLGKLGKSVDRIYSNMQKEKLDDTSAYVASLQRFFEAAMVLEGIMHYFSRIAGDSEMAGWFTEVPQSPISMSGRRNHVRGHPESGSISAASPSMPHATLVSEASMSSINSASERKSSNASISVAASAAEKKSRRRSNYFGQRQNSTTGILESSDPMPASRLPTKPRGDSFSAIPRVVPLPAPAVNSASNGTSANMRFVLAPSPIKNPASYVHQGRGRAPGVIYARLVKVTEWLNQVILAWVVRDLQVLYAKYIKRLREWIVE
ncbi:hypothetical protein BX667DRAFT_509147 [Coemansia mojavensis]|nr:hypothetical protein BX667DRAFT_509147 [Coemansia mojavensis]